MKKLLKQIISVALVMLMVLGSVFVAEYEFTDLRAKAATDIITVTSSPEKIYYSFDSEANAYINGECVSSFPLDLTFGTKSEEEIHFSFTVTVPDGFSTEEDYIYWGQSVSSNTTSGRIIEIFVSNPLAIRESEIVINVYSNSELVGYAVIPVVSSSANKTVTGYFMNTDGTYPNYLTTMFADENGNVAGFTHDEGSYYMRNLYTLTFDVEGLEESITVYYGAQIYEWIPEEPAKEGYNFLGWVDEKGSYDIPETMPAYNLTLTAKFDTMKFTATFITGGGLPVRGYTYEVALGDQIPIPPNPTKEGYTFAGWSPAVGTMDYQGMTFNATWILNAYTITYFNQLGEKIYSSACWDYGNYVYLPGYTVPEGYEFLGWCDENGNVYNDGFRMPAKNLNLYATCIDPTTSEEYICVYSTNPTLSVVAGEQFDLSFSLYKNGAAVSDWNKFALTLGNKNIIDISEYKKNEKGFYVTIYGAEPGTTELIVTDTDSGVSNTVEIKVFASDCDVYSYRMDDVPEFYPDSFGDTKILTNFFNINGLYVSDYTYSKNNSENTYTVTFNAYNYFAHYGSVDVYDSNGKWIASDCINKATTPASLWEVGESAYYLVSDTVTGKLLSYKAASFSEKSEIKIEVPEGGYFAISNNITQSPGTFIYNIVDYLMKTIKYATSFVKIESVSNEIIDKLVDKNMITDILTDKFHSISFNFCEVALKAGFSDAAGAMATDFEDLLNSLGISWKSVFAAHFGLSEEVFTEITGPVGASLKLCFLISDASDILRQTMNLTSSKNAEYVVVHTPSEFNNSTMNKVTVSDPNNCIDEDAVLQVFKIVKSDEIRVSLNQKTSFDDYEIVNIKIMKGGKNVNPNGKVLVGIPIPDGFDGKTCQVLRQEEDGSWTILNAWVEGNYLVFETDHFSLYALTGNYIDNLSIHTKPDKTNYNLGDVLDITGLSLVIKNSDGTEEIISEGLICTPTVLSIQGVQTVSVYYGDVCCKFKVNVGLKNIKLSISVPDSRTIKYGEETKLYAKTANLPAGAKIKWTVEGEGVRLSPSSSGKSCKVTAVSTGNVVISAYVVDRNGNIITDESGKRISDSEHFYSEANFWLRVIYFFKKIFGFAL